MQLFPNGVKGLADSKWSGVLGAAYRLVGLDLHSKPGLIRVAQKLAKASASTITDLCKACVNVSDGSRLWFSSTTGKVWREVGGVYTLIYTIVFPAEPFSSPKQYTVLVGDSNQKWGISDGAQTGLVPTNEFTVAAWLQLRSLPAIGEYYTIIDKYLESGDQRSYTVRIYNNAGTYQLYFISSVNGTAGGASVVRQTITPKLGEWFHFAMSVASGNTADQVKFYINGAQVGTTQSSLMGANTFFDCTAGFGIGGPYAENARNFDGWIAYVMFWTNIQNATAIANLYADATAYSATGLGGFWKFNGDGTDETANNNDLTNQNTATFATFGSNTPTVIPLDATEHEGYIYYAVKDRLQRILVTNIASSWTGNVETAGLFSITDDTYHPMAKANLSLFIGDKTVIAQVDQDNAFTPATLLNVQADERITALGKIDTDILIGLLKVNIAKVLRWDTVSDSWNAEDEIPEKGINAFIYDDNYMYVNAGEFGSLYFYNGEKLVPYKRLPGDWTPSAKAIINRHSVASLLGVPVFGVSNSTGNPILQGVYSFGSYSKDYAKILDLTYPISSGEFSGVTIGGVLVDGADLYVAWKGASTQGVDKLDWSNKYTAAYLESMQLISQKERAKLKTLVEFSAEYASLPASTDITLKYDKNYTGSYTTAVSVKDTNLLQKRARKSINKIGALQLRADFTVSGNNAPEVEGFSYLVANEVK